MVKYKKLVLLALFFVLAGMALAEATKVFILNFNYDNGKITLKDKMVKIGYSPDRRAEPEDGYRAEVISIYGTLLYSFKFEIPLDIYVDAMENNEMTGGLMRLNETDFALVVPYFEDAKAVRIYKEGNSLVEVDVEEKAKKRSKLWLIIPAFIVIFILALAYFVLKRRKRKNLYRY